jgi:hypothetical protein
MLFLIQGSIVQFQRKIEPLNLKNICNYHFSNRDQIRRAYLQTRVCHFLHLIIFLIFLK